MLLSFLSVSKVGQDPSQLLIETVHINVILRDNIEALVKALRWSHRCLDVQCSNVLPVLLEKRDEKID